MTHVASLFGTVASLLLLGMAAGHWEGSLNIPGVELEVVVDLDREDTGGFKGEIDIPLQGIRNLELTGVIVDGNAISFSLPGIPGEPTFRGDLSEDGSTLSGELDQAGQKFPMRLARSGQAEFGVVEDDGFELVEQGQPGQGLPGEWHARLVVGPSSLRLVVEITRDTEGLLHGTLDSLDQGAMDIPLDEVVLSEGEMSFRMSRLGAGYDGTLNADGSEISGTWRQGGVSLPLKFQRAR